MNNELKPCPFCGGKPQIDSHFYGGGEIYQIWCTDCGVSKNNFPTREKAIAAWNKRVTEEKQ